MPYSRKPYASKRQPRKATPAVKQYVKRAIESKRDTITSCNQVATSGIGYDAPLILDITPLGAKSQGQDIDFVGVDLNIRCERQLTTQWRVVVVQWFADSGDALPTIADVFCNVASSQSYYDGFNQAHIHQKFVVVKDKFFQTSPNLNDSQKLFKLNITPRNLQRKVIRSTGSSQYKNQLYLMVFTNNPATSPSLCDVGYTFKHKDRD